jgi:hypothetical protein
MTRPRILQPGQSYTFSEYFELSFAIEDILTDNGCFYNRAEKIIIEDIKLYQVPEEIHLLVNTLVGILNY